MRVWSVSASRRKQASAVGLTLASQSMKLLLKRAVDRKKPHQVIGAESE